MALMENGERLKWLQSLAVFVFANAHGAGLYSLAALSSPTPKAFANCSHQGCFNPGSHQP
jgi:hypothetical protein